MKIEPRYLYNLTLLCKSHFSNSKDNYLLLLFVLSLFPTIPCSAVCLYSTTFYAEISYVSILSHLKLNTLALPCSILNNNNGLYRCSLFFGNEGPQKHIGSNSRYLLGSTCSQHFEAREDSKILCLLNLNLMLFYSSFL